MTHKFVIELVDGVNGYEDGVDYLERIYGAEEITDNEIYNQAFNDGYKQGRAEVINEIYAKFMNEDKDSILEWLQDNITD